MTNLKSQSGRSMVEMLGVLAIIGVLSIGGIAGYTMAMNRYRANEVLSIAAQLAVLSQTADQGKGGPVDLTDLGLTSVAGLKSDATIQADTSGNATTVTITGLSDDKIAKAIQSIAGGGDNCSGETCSLVMSGSALTVGTKPKQEGTETPTE